MTAKNSENPENSIPTENPVGQRRPLRLTHQEVDAREPQTSAVHKIAENQIGFCTRLDVMDADLVSVGRDMILGFAGLSEQIYSLAGLPPMRRHSDSSNAIEQVSESAAERVLAKAQEIDKDPHTQLTPDVWRQLMKQEAQKVLEEQREHERVKQLEAAETKRLGDAATAATEAERVRLQQVEDVRQKAKEKRATRNKIIVACVSTALAMLLAAFTAYTQGHAKRADEEHASGFKEGLSAAPTTTTVVGEVFTAAATASASTPPLRLAPAAVAPKH